MLMINLDNPMRIGSKLRLVIIIAPCPGITEPDGRQHIQSSILRTTIMYSYFYQDILRCAFGIFNKYVEVFIFIKYPEVNQFKFRLIASAGIILVNQPCIKKNPQQKKEQQKLVRMRGRVV